MWGFSIAGLVIVAFIGYFYQGIPAGAVLGAVAMVSVLLAASYYMRVKPCLTLNRAAYLLLGFSPIGFLLWLVEAFALSHVIVMGSLAWPLDLVSIVVPFIIGVFTGDWMGKMRDYRLPLSP